MELLTNDTSEYDEAIALGQIKIIVQDRIENTKNEKESAELEKKLEREAPELENEREHELAIRLEFLKNQMP